MLSAEKLHDLGVEKLAQIVLVEAEQNAGFDSFVGSVKKILYVAGSLLLCYLALPFLWTKKCMDGIRVETDEKLTKGPFPHRPPTGKDK